MTNMSEAVANALESATIDPRDKAAAALCRHYAFLMDDAERMAEEAEGVWEELSLDDIDGRRRLVKLEAMLSPRVTASDLGPKLLAGLTALGLTLAGRGEKGKEPERAPDPAVAKLLLLKSRSAERKYVPAAVDAPATGA